MPKSLQVLAGATFGEWKVVQELPPSRDAGGRSRRSILVECSCGKRCVVRPANLLDGSSLRCAKCSASKRSADKTVRVGEICGSWTAVEVVGDLPNNSAAVIAKCKCGRQQKMTMKSFRSRKSDNCKLCQTSGRKLESGEKLIGDCFGGWTVIEGGHVIREQGGNFSAVLVRCDCGFEKKMKIFRLTSGQTTQCVSCSRKSHGMSHTAEYRSWEAMIRRCYVPHSTAYKYYGGRGVTVCDRWLPAKGGSFENFLRDLGPKPSPEHHLDKDLIEGNLIYGPDTAKWVHRDENAKRKRNAVWVVWQEKRIRLSELAAEVGIPVKTLWERIKRCGMSVEDAIARR